MAAKAKKSDADEKARQPASRDVVAEQDAEVRKAKVAERKARAAREEAERKAHEARHAFAIKRRSEADVIARREAERATVQVIVQTRRSEPVRVSVRYPDKDRGPGFIPCNTPVMVPRAILRQLEGFRNAGRIQLVIGEIKKPGPMVDRADDKGKPIKFPTGKDDDTKE